MSHLNSPVSSRPGSPIQQSLDPALGSINGNSTSHNGHDVGVANNQPSQTVVASLSQATEDLTQQTQNQAPTAFGESQISHHEGKIVITQNQEMGDDVATSITSTSVQEEPKRGILNKIFSLFSRNKSPAVDVPKTSSTDGEEKQNGAILQEAKSQEIVLGEQKLPVKNEGEHSTAVIKAVELEKIDQETTNDKSTVASEEKKSNSGWGFWPFNRNSPVKKEAAADSDVIVEQSDITTESEKTTAVAKENGIIKTEGKKSWSFPALWSGRSNKPAPQETVIVEPSNALSEDEDVPDISRSKLEIIEEEKKSTDSAF